jgi:endonuclease YncB( thermonuclease family)
MQDKKRLPHSTNNYSFNLIVALLISLCLSAFAEADIFKWKDSKGNEHYSDRSQDHAKPLHINPGYGFYSIRAIYDGDTVQLEDGRKIRLLGINTPEIEHRDKSTEAGGEVAKTWLINKLQNTKVRLEIGVEKTDKYGRTLAHLFTENKEHINVSLVKAGLATLSIYPPNLKYVAKLQAAENEAQKNKLGLWNRPEYAAIDVNQLTDAGHAGWTRIVGKVTAVHISERFVYLEFSNHFDARIEKDWLSLFPDINSYVGKTVEVRGWLNRHKDQFSMLVRHPVALIVLSD